MNSKLYPAPFKVASKLSKYNGSIVNESQSRKDHSSFLYVGSDKDFSHFLQSIFHAEIISNSLHEVQLMLQGLPRRMQPEVICIDIAFEKKELIRFRRFLAQKNMLSGIVIIYNETKLAQTDIEFLKAKELVDDVINLHTSADSLSRRINFLKKVKSSSIHPSSSRIAKKDDRNVNQLKRNSHLKRSFDIIFALFFLVLLFPVFIIIALGIRLDSRGPVVYNSLRAGRGFKIFKFYKFRTMVVDADKKIEEYAHLNQYSLGMEGNASFVKIANDPRITRFGKFLRNCSLDELPQLINVLKGDMSLVGNRPLPLYEASTLTTNDHVERFMAPAGITGLWQIKKRGKAEMSTEERISLDISYARRYNIVYDLWIVAKTPAALFQKSNA